MAPHPSTFTASLEAEPRSFVLAEDEKGRVLEAFTPDFYLPEQDLYLEVTVMKQSLITRKNRENRELRERYPGREDQGLHQAPFRSPGPRIQLNLVRERASARRR